MTKIFAFFFTIILSFQILKSQQFWSNVNEISLGGIVTNNNIYFTVGNYGFISRSKDNGNNWTLINSNTSRNLNSIIQLTNNRLIIVGDNGVILISNDTGSSWNKIQLDYNNNLKSVCLFDSLNIIIVGDSGLILKSVDGGINYNKIESNTNSNLYKVKRSSNYSVTIIGDKGTILHSTDFGKSWRSKLNLLSEYLKDIDFYNSKVGTITSNHGILRTNDSGYNWSELKQTDPTKTFFNSIKHISSDSLISLYGVIKISIDSGKTWKETNDVVNLDQSIYITSNSINDNNCLMVGNIILISNDKYKSNIAISKLQGNGINDLIAFDDTSLFIGRDLNRYGDRSFDMGLTWITTNRGFFSVDKFIQISQDSAIAYSLNTISNDDFRAWVTGDKGNSWGYYETNFNLSDYDLNSANWKFKNISFANKYIGSLNLNRGPGFDIGKRTKNLLLYTKDAGLNWDTAKVDNNPNKEYSALFLVNEKLGFASSLDLIKNIDSSFTTTNRIYKTTDGGMNWVTIKQFVSDFNDSVHFKNFFFKDSLDGFAVGQNAKLGAVLHHTTNGGIDWITTQFKGVNSLNNVKFFNNNIGFLLGSQGNLFSTSDGGINWVKEKLWYEDLVDYSFNLEDIYIMPNRKTLFLKMRIDNASGASIFRKTLTNQIPISSVNEHKSFNIISDISPNPTNDFVNIKCESFLNKEVDVKLLNSISEVVFSGKFINSSDGFYINVSNIPNGFYNVVIKVGEKRSFQKLIVEH